MVKGLVEAEWNRLVARYTRHNTQSGREYAKYDVVRQGVPRILNDVSIYEADKHKLL